MSRHRPGSPEYQRRTNLIGLASVCALLASLVIKIILIVGMIR
jgi:hypothetical protein